MLPFKKNRKIKFDILTIFFSIYFGSIAIIIYYSYTSSDEAILKMASQLVEETNESILERLDNFIKPIPFFNIAAFLLSDETLEIADMKSLTSFMHIILKTYPQLANAYIADTKGNLFIENQISTNTDGQRILPFYDKLHIPSATKYISEAVNLNSTTKIEVTYIDSMGDLIEKESFHYTYDPRLRPWYIGAQKSNDHYWIGEYQSIGSPSQIVSISYPIYINGKFTGVAGADISINLVNAELEKYAINERSLLAIISDHGKIITSVSEFFHNQADHVKTNNENDLIKTAYKINHFSNKNTFMFKYNHETYMAYFSLFAISNTDHWMIGSIIPIEPFEGAINQANRRILIFSTFMGLLGVALIIIFSHTISRPIIQIAKETNEIPKLNFDKIKSVDSNIYEIQIMNDALMAAKSALSSFIKYVPKALVEQLIRNKLVSQLDGKNCKITVMFSDIANFTTTTEETDAEFLLAHLSEYLNALTHIIQKHSGNIDKYVGDSIMAFWGAPLPDDNQIINACYAVLACRDEVHRLNKEWIQLGKPTFLTRFGLHSGVAIVGNVGSSDRLNYTAIGDTVNIASRLEELNKTYHTEIIVSNEIYTHAKNHFEFQSLGTASVRGKKIAVPIYELLKSI